MSVTTLEKIKGLENEEIKTVDDYKMKTPKNLPQGFFSLLSVGNSGSGKTNACLNLIKRLRPYYNVYILISPTGTYDHERQQRAEKKYETLGIEWDEEFQEYSHGLIQSILARQKQRLIDYEEWMRYKPIYKRFLSWMRRHDVEMFPDMLDQFPEIETLFRHDFAHPNDEFEFPWQIVPTCMLVIDDMASTPIYTNSIGELTNLQMKNRHYKMSVFNLVQAYKLCPRSIRLNSTVMMMFGCKSLKMVKEFAESCNTHFTPEEFLKLFEYATRDKPYHFLYIDCRLSKDECMRKNFNEKITIKDVKDDAPAFQTEKV